MFDCWLSPEGKFYYCYYPPVVQAEYICEEVYGEIYDDDNTERDNPERFLEINNWMKYSNYSKMWLKDRNCKLTEAQIKAIREATGEDISWMEWLYERLFHLFFCIFICYKVKYFGLEGFIMDFNWWLAAARSQDKKSFFIDKDGNEIGKDRWYSSTITINWVAMAYKNWQAVLLNEKWEEIDRIRGAKREWYNIEK